MSSFVRSFVYVLSSTRPRLSNGAVWLWNKLTKPQSLDEDLRRKEFILNVLLVFSNIVVWLMYISVLYNQYDLGLAYHGINSFLFLAIACCFLLLIILSHAGYIHTASVGLITIYFIGSTFGAIHWGADLQMIILAYVTIILIAFILEKPKYAVATSLIICLTDIIVWNLETRHLIAFDHTWSDRIFPSDAYEFVVMFLIITAVAWLGRREIIRSLTRARTSEHDLQLERDSLEIKVEERTQELRTLQAEKIAEMYEFVEFGRLSAGIFHDISSPLSALTLSVDHLKSGNNRVYEIETDIERIAKASTKLGQLVKAVQKIVSHQVERRQFSINDEIRDACEILKHKANLASVTISTNLEHGLELYGDPLRLHQVILNIVSNAIDAMETIPLNERFVSISTNQTSNAVEIHITDNGSGIPYDIQQRIFDPFFTTKPKHKGTGIGLSQTKDIVEKEFHGTIQVSSTPRNTHFIITITK